MWRKWRTFFQLSEPIRSHKRQRCEFRPIGLRLPMSMERNSNADRNAIEVLRMNEKIRGYDLNWKKKKKRKKYRGVMLPLFHNFLSFKTFVIQFDQTRSTVWQTSSAVFSRLRGFCLNLSKSLLTPHFELFGFAWTNTLKAVPHWEVNWIIEIHIWTK